MDYIVANWQEIISLGIVAVAAVLLIRSEVQQQKKHDCSSCSLAEMQSRQKYSFKQ